MISLHSALELKEAGLSWEPKLLDCFGLPDRNMDDKVFVISDMLVTVDVMQGLQVIAFQGASEWAIDSLATTEAVWLPTETQLRQALEAALLEAGRPELRLSSGLGGYRLDFVFQDEPIALEGREASELYARALLLTLKGASNLRGGP